MPIPITMPRLSDTMEEGTLVKWHVKVGDTVASGDHLADVETDKATMELQAFDDGTVAELVVEEGQNAPVGGTILVLAEDGESVEDAAKAAGDGKADGDQPKARSKAKAPKADDTEDESDERESAEAAEDKPKAAGKGGRALRISPLARKLAEEHGVDLSRIEGSGPDGRIIKRDILAAAESGKSRQADKAAPTRQPAARTAAAPAPAPAAAPRLEDKLHSLSNMRKTIAKRLLESKTTVPHFTVTVSVNMDPLLELRATLNEQLEAQGIKISVNDFIVRAAGLAILQHPLVNSSWTDKGVQQHGQVNVGVAVALPEERGGGLVVPVINDVPAKGLRQIGDETRKLAKKARETGLTTDEMSGGTFTLSNLGMYGVDHFEAIINPPQAAILAVGAALAKPVVRDGQIVVGHEMTCTLSADHRVIDGALAAEYLVSLKQLLEAPASLMV